MIRKPTAVLAATLAFASVAAFGSPAFADQIRDKQWHLRYLKVSEAHRFSTGKGVTVAVIDSGVSKHPDLDGSILKGTDFVDPGGSGQNDTDGHGTKMAGLIAGHGVGGGGALGIAPDAKIMPIKVQLDLKGIARDFGPAVNYAVKHGAKVINMSVGAAGVTADLYKAVNDAANADVVIVAAAGNSPEDSSITSPARLTRVVAVGATNKSGNISKVSVAGPELDIVAPGEDIEGPGKNGSYGVGTGTSDSTAIVSGAAALLRSKYPEMSAKEVVERLESTAVDKGAPGVDDEYGHGVLDIVAALEAGGPGAGAPSAGATSSASDPSTNASDSVALPEAENSSGSGSGLLIAGIVLVVLVAAGALFFVLRARSRSTS
ncbi:type VII secretion-associated serine protease mycosin [Winogradskya humida]|uniref:Peptidase S8/S53 domain-containing protein n=1 Tax=Winogradskya humida TaxID=113566 RepID=A0ABQ3ZRM3_9ACTN|nr:type VII secretion-associated serine protease mycosin [Actinoplanes humidus]GIE21207.1 hypothetical protein Ahu01nite_043090 [Actinoplanes humidus]